MTVIAFPSARARAPGDILQRRRRWGATAINPSAPLEDRMRAVADLIAYYPPSDESVEAWAKFEDELLVEARKCLQG